MTGKLDTQGLDTLELRFQALRDQIGAMPEACRPELEGALQELSQAIAALRSDREAGGTPQPDPPRGREAQAGQAGKKHSPTSPEVLPSPCEVMLRHVFNAIPDLLTVHDRDFNTIMSNWHGYESVPEAERRGRPKCYRVYRHRDRPCDNCHAHEVLATGQPVKVTKVNPVDGRVWEVSAYPIRDESGQVALVVEHMRDITERHLAEQALKESEDRFRTLIEDSPESLFLTDVQGTVLAASRVAARRLGENLDQIIGVLSFDLFPPEVSARRREMFDQAVATGLPVRLEDARGDRHFDIHYNPILDADGKVSRVSVLGIEITDRKKAEQALKESEATLRTLIEANPESLFLLDTRGVILAASHVAAQRLGKSLEEIIGTDLHGMLPPEVSKKRFEIMQKLVTTGKPARFEDLRGDFYFDSSITPIFDQDKVVQVAVLAMDITNRKHAEQALKDSEARFRAIFATAQDTVFIKDRSFRYTQVNPAMERLYGRPEAEIIGKTDLELVGAADAERIWKQDRRVLNGEVVKGAHTVPAQGVPVTFHYIKAPLHDEAGEIVGICGIARDISDLRRAEDALEESEERFRMLFDHVPDAYILADMQGEIIDCNQAAEDLAGYGREELVGNNFACLPWLDFRQQVRLADLLAQTARGEVMGPVDFNLTRKDGGEVIAEGMSLPLYIQGQNLVLTIIRDVTARKRAEAGLRESEERFRMLFEHAPDSYILSNNQGEIIDCNKATDDLTGYLREELIGKNFAYLPILDLQQQIRMTELLAQAAPGEILGPLDFSFIRKDGREVLVEGKSLPLNIQGRTMVLAIARDITARKLAEEALRESEERYRALFDASPDAITVMDLEMNFLMGNRRGLEIWGQDSLDQGRFRKAIEYIVPEDRPRAMAAMQALLATGQTQTFDTTMVKQDGTRFPSLNSAALIRDFAGKPQAIIGVARDITALKQAEAGLRESEQRFRDIIENAAEWVWEVDPQGKYTYSSPVVAQFLGYKPEEILGQYFYDTFLPEEREELKSAALATFAVKQPFKDFDNTNLHKDGRIVRLSTSGVPILDEQGNLLGYRGADIDITARKQAEEALAAHLEFLRLLLDTIPNPIFFKDAQGFYLGCNKAFEDFVGITRQEIVGKSVYDVSPRELADEYHRMDVAAFEATGTQVYESRVQAADGTRRHVVFHKATFPDPAGGVGGLVGIITDITGLKQAEAELRQSEQRFRLMAETIQDVFWIATPRIGKTVYVSPGFEYIWGRTSEALYRHPKLFLETVHPEDRERVKSEIIAARERGVAWDHEYRIIRPDGTMRWILNRGFPVRDDQGIVTLFTGVATDITEHKAMEGQLLQAQKMEAVGRLAGGVAHDFNNLLMAITGYGELMRAKVLKDDPLYGHLENILKAGERATALTQQLLTFSRQKIVHPEVIDLNQVLLDLEPMLRRLIGEDLDLEVITDPKPAAVKADPGQMGQIIMNLVVNARDAMPQGGRLTLKTAAVDFMVGCNTRFGLVPPGAYLMLVAQDTGVGMDEATQAYVFEPFFTTKETGKGTGLGLSTVYGIVKQSGGYLDLESSPGAGSTFTIYLPRLEATVVPPKAKIPITASFQGEETVLLVEDEDMLRGLLAKYLRLYGYTVLEARHGGEALLTCERHPGPIHLMVTDVVMPQMSGRELADRLTPLRPEMKILYMSGYTEDALVQHGVADLAVAFLQKPFRPIELARRVHAVLHPPVSQ
jgi:PAS domain S-box-containing protein